MMDEVKNSVKDGIVTRISSPLYGAFVISWVVVNWQVFVILFFVDEVGIWEKTGLLKNEFVYQYLLNPLSWSFYVNLFITVVLTFLVIWIFPRWLARPAYRQQARDVVEKKIIRIYEETRLREEQRKLALVEIELLEKKKEQAEQNKEIEAIKTTEEEKWKEEFERTTKDSSLQDFMRLVKVLYEKSGELYSQQLGDYLQSSGKALAFSETRDLISRDDKGKIKLTDKGKYFYRRFSDSGMISF